MKQLFRDITNTFVSVAKGMWVTLVHWGPFRKSVTELYPEVQPKLPENYRGMPTLPIDPKTRRNRCIACGACARMCPEQVITVEAEKGGDPKDRKPAVFKIDISRCMWCGLCMEVCPKNCLRPARTFEHATYTREGMICDLADLEKLGGEFPAEEAPTQPEDDSNEKARKSEP